MNQQPASYTNERDANLLTATVKFISNDEFHLECGHSMIKAKKAISCLVTPEVGDTILFTQTNKHVFILAVLMRETPHELKLDCPQGLAISSNKSINLSADTIHCHATTHLEQQSAAFSLKATDSVMELNNSIMKGFNAQFIFHHCKFASKLFKVMAKTLSQQCKRAHYFIAGLEHKVIGNARTIINHYYRVDCEEFDVHSEEEVRLKGKKIHLG